MSVLVVIAVLLRYKMEPTKFTLTLFDGKKSSPVGKVGFFYQVLEEGVPAVMNIHELQAAIMQTSAWLEDHPEAFLAVRLA